LAACSAGSMSAPQVQRLSGTGWMLPRSCGPGARARYGAALPDVQEAILVAAVAAHWFMAFSASPHSHWNPALSDPPPSRRSTNSPRVLPYAYPIRLTAYFRGNLAISRQRVLIPVA